MKNRDIAKRRIMFIQKEDYNYLIYNLLLILNNLGCTSDLMAFKDFRRIAYILDFIGADKSFEDYTQNELGSIYLKAQVKKKLLSHVLIILKNKDFIDMSINARHQTFNIWLKKENIPLDFWDLNLFELELSRLTQIKKMVPKLRIGTIKTLADSLFGKKNVLIWEI